MLLQDLFSGQRKEACNKQQLLSDKQVHHFLIDPELSLCFDLWMYWLRSPMKIFLQCWRSILLDLNLAFNILHNQTQSYFYCSITTHTQTFWEIYLLANSKHAQHLLDLLSLFKPSFLLYSVLPYPSVARWTYTYCKQFYLIISCQRYLSFYKSIWQLYCLAYIKFHVKYLMLSTLL